MWPNLGPNDVHARVSTGEHVTKVSLNTSYQGHLHSFIKIRWRKLKIHYKKFISDPIPQLLCRFLPLLPFFSRARFFPDMRFSQHDHDNETFHFPQQKVHQWTRFFVKTPKPYFWAILGPFWPNLDKWDFFLKNRAANFEPLWPPNFMKKIRKN